MLARYPRTDFVAFSKAWEKNGEIVVLDQEESCGHVIAALSVQGAKSLNGQFVSWDSKECEPYRNT
jgi:hypothetical protein